MKFVSDVMMMSFCHCWFLGHCGVLVHCASLRFLVLCGFILFLTSLSLRILLSLHSKSSIPLYFIVTINFRGYFIIVISN